MAALSLMVRWPSSSANGWDRRCWSCALHGRWLAWPNGFLTFFGDRFARLAQGWTSDTATLQSLLFALAPFALRPDTGAEMDSYRADSFGQRMGIKPGTEKELEGGK